MDFSLNEKTQTMLAMIGEFVNKELLPMEEAFLRQPFRDLLPEIEKKRDALGINKKTERKLYDMKDRRELDV